MSMNQKEKHHQNGVNKNKSIKENKVEMVYKFLLKLSFTMKFNI